LNSDLLFEESSKHQPLAPRSCGPVMNHRVLAQKLWVQYHSQTITQGLKITEEKVLLWQLHLQM